MHYDVRLPARCESRAIVNLAKRSIYLGLLGLAIARLPASALLVIVHRAVLTALFATGRLLRRKRDGAHHCNQDREQDFAVIFHRISFVPRAEGASKNRAYRILLPFHRKRDTVTVPLENGRQNALDYARQRMGYGRYGAQRELDVVETITNEDLKPVI